MHGHIGRWLFQCFLRELRIDLSSSNWLKQPIPSLETPEVSYGCPFVRDAKFHPGVMQMPPFSEHASYEELEVWLHMHKPPMTHLPFLTSNHFSMPHTTLFLYPMNTSNPSPWWGRFKFRSSFGHLVNKFCKINFFDGWQWTKNAQFPVLPNQIPDPQNYDI